jgi:ABC-type nitrate/sulfonate/bicarbonate transport system substrate-binding protein
LSPINRGGSTAVQALLAGEIQYGHLSPAPMMTAWSQGAHFVWVGTTTHQLVFIFRGALSDLPDLLNSKTQNQAS